MTGGKRSKYRTEDRPFVIDSDGKYKQKTQLHCDFLRQRGAEVIDKT